MKNFKILILHVFLLGLAIVQGYSQTEVIAEPACKGYPQDEMCCQKNRGAWVISEPSNFCYLNLLTSRATKAGCLESGGYAYWRNDSTLLCIPKGTLVMSGNVIETDEAFKTIALMSGGQSYTIIAGDAVLPKQGDQVDVYYTVDPDGTMRGKSVQTAGKNSDE